MQADHNSAFRTCRGLRAQRKSPRWQPIVGLKSYP